MCSLQLPIPLSPGINFRNSNNIIRKPLYLSIYPSNLTQPCKTNSYSVLRPRLAGRQKCAVSEIDNEKNQTELPEGLEAELMPKHVAVIMDGNRRWAQSRGLQPHQGHRAGGKAYQKLLMNCLKYGVKVLTVFAFSTENWTRAQEEVNFLMVCIGETISIGDETLTQHDVRVSFMGSRGQLPEPLQKLMSDVEERTKHKKGMHLVVAVNYGGRYDITEATRKIATKVKHGVLQVEDIDDAVFEQHLETNSIEFPNPDLLIRSGGELRASNFMMWQLAYSEMFFTDELFPDFDDADFVDALAAFQRRRRRFGGT